MTTEVDQALKSAEEWLCAVQRKTIHELRERVAELEKENRELIAGLVVYLPDSRQANEYLRAELIRRDREWSEKLNVVDRQLMAALRERDAAKDGENDQDAN